MLVRFTNVDGEGVWLDCNSPRSVCFNKEDKGTVITTLGAEPICVRESVDEVGKTINAMCIHSLMLGAGTTKN